MLTFATDDKSLDLQALKISTEMNKAGNSDKYVANEEIDDFFVGNPDDFQEDVENSYTDEPTTVDSFDEKEGERVEKGEKTTRKGCLGVALTFAVVVALIVSLT